MLSLTVNFWAILVAAVVSFIVGWLWYSPVLFGNVWMKAMGMTKEKMAHSQKNMAVTMLVALIAQFMIAFILAHFISGMGAVGWMESIVVAFWAWLGFVALISLGTVLWEGKSMKLFWINSIHWLVALAIQAAIISAWM